MKSFLFAQESPRTVAFLRIGVGIVFFFDAIIRWPYTVELFTTDGMPMPLFPGTWLEPVSMDAITGVLLYSILLFGLICIMIGWKTRWSLCVVFALSCWFGLLDNAGTFKKYSVIELHLLLLLFFSHCHLHWSVDALLKRSSRQFSFIASAWPRRLIQVLLSSIYLQSVITKVRLTEFASGDVLLFNMLDDRWGGTWLGMWMATDPLQLVVVSLGTMFFEMAAGLLLWVRAARVPMLFVAFLFHVGIWMTMHVGIFSPVMLVLLAAFVGEDDWRRIKSIFGRILPTRVRNTIERYLKNLREKFLSLSEAVLIRSRSRNEEDTTFAIKFAKEWSCYLLAVCVFVIAGYQYQIQVDRYHVFGEETELKWVYLHDDFIDEITKPTKIAAADHIVMVETGDRLGVIHAFGEKEKYPLGFTLHTFIRLDPNHPALKMEYILQRDEVDYEYRKKFTIAAGSHLSSHGFYFPEEVGRLGKYTISLEAEGEEVFRKHFELVPN